MKVSFLLKHALSAQVNVLWNTNVVACLSQQSIFKCRIEFNLLENAQLKYLLCYSLSSILMLMCVQYLQIATCLMTVLLQQVMPYDYFDV